MKISFVDFWSGFDPNNNFLFFLFREIYENLEVVNPINSDLIIYSCFGSEHLKYNQKKIFYTGENIRPNFNECDYSLSFDIDDYGGKNIRLPLWYFYISWFDGINYSNPKFTLPVDQINDNIFIRKEKNKFCSTVYSNESKHRKDFFDILSLYKKVDGYGRPFNNWNSGEDKKYEIISDYKFNICFENSDYLGYHTEKLFHAKTAGCIPIYWGSESVVKDFNEKCFINLKNFNEDLTLLSEYIKEIDNDDILYKEIKNEPLFITTPSLDEIINKIKKII
jgi:hypothetical protein